MSRSCAVFAVLAVVALASGARGEEAAAPGAAARVQDTGAPAERDGVALPGDEPASLGAEAKNAPPGSEAPGGSAAPASPATGAQASTSVQEVGRAAEGPPPVARKLSLSGPRIGVTYLSDGIVRKLRDRYGEGFNDLTPVVSQFGWQWERQIGGGDGPVVALTEWVLLVGGLEQGVFLPSLTWLVGVRSRGGQEFGVGPNITPAGTALAIAGGFTVRAGALSFPFNLAVVPSKSGVRVSLLCGFTTR